MTCLLMKSPRVPSLNGLFLFLTAFPALAAINTDGQLGDLRTISATTWGMAKLNIGFDVNYAQDNSYVKGPVDTTTFQLLSNSPVDSNGNPISTIDPARLFSANLSAAIGITPFWDVALSLPFYYDWSGFSRDFNDGGVGDLEISTKIAQPLVANIYRQSYYLSVTAPVGMADHGIFPRHAYLLDKAGNSLSYNPATSFYSYSNPIIKGLLLWTLDFAGLKTPFPVTINLNIGGALSTDWQKRNMVIGGLSADYTPVSFVTLFVDMNAESRWSSFSAGINMLRDPFYCSPGIRINTPAGLALTVAGDFSLSSSANDARNNWHPAGTDYYYSTAPVPRLGVHFGLGWNGFLVGPETGRKKEPDAHPGRHCPDGPRNIAGMADTAGCPDPDWDHDGLCDPWVSAMGLEAKYANVCAGVDQCPYLAGPRDGLNDNAGCPVPDNDNDGLCDPWVSALHLEAKYANVCTGVDQCPNEPEDFDGYEDLDGCPDPDNDHDGIPDIKDLCPNQPEIFNGYKDEDGCPDTLPVTPPPKKKEPDLPKSQVLRSVSFRPNTAEITPDSYIFMDPVVRKLKEFPDVEVEVRSYTDSLGRYDQNLQLTQRRAEAVRQYFISQGIDGSRIQAVGMGPTSPVADNRTAAGRAQNRRIEVIRTK
jgi:outer membrane protein OmpA-like peptidoglycan-associated protein